MNLIYTILIFATLSSILYSCTENRIERVETETGYNYYPLKVGKQWIYEVDSTVYNNFKVVAGSKSQIKEEIVDTFLLNDRLEYIIRRSVRSNENTPWRSNGVLTTTLQDDKIIRTDNNLKFIKMVFPIRNGKTWDGNVYFNSDRTTVKVYGEPLTIYKDWNYEMTLTDSTAQVGGMQYDSILDILHTESETLFTYNKSQESYAKNVGMISREHIYYITNNNDPTKPISERVEYGFETKYTLIDFK